MPELNEHNLGDPQNYNKDQYFSLLQKEIKKIKKDHPGLESTYDGAQINKVANLLTHASEKFKDLDLSSLVREFNELQTKALFSLTKLFREGDGNKNN
jgi:hypothetical protein